MCILYMYINRSKHVHAVARLQCETLTWCLETNSQQQHSSEAATATHSNVADVVAAGTDARLASSLRC